MWVPVDTNRRTSLTLPNSVVATYAYTNRDELASITFKKGTVTLGTLTYTYDAAGRRQTVGGTWARTGLPAALASATYDDANRQLTWGGQTLTYDDNGNLTSDGTNTYTWDARDRLASISGGVTATFAYDPFGRRTRKTIGAQTTDYLNDWDNPVQELSGSTDLANLLTGLGIDEYFTRTDGSGRRSLLGDALGSVLALTDDAGVVQTSYTYEPFGQTTVSGQTNGNPLQYTGRENDGTGLYYYRARYYSPARQRFIAEDPIGFAGGDANLYAYVWNAPLDYTDPTGGIMVPFPSGHPCSPSSTAGRYPNLSALACAAATDPFGVAGGFGAGGLGRLGGAGAAQALKKAKEVFKAIQKRGGASPPGYKGGGSWANKGNPLPRGNYHEYDIDPHIKGQPRGPGRIVLDPDTGFAYYTPDHYKTFIPLNP